VVDQKWASEPTPRTGRTAQPEWLHDQSLASDLSQPFGLKGLLAQKVAPGAAWKIDGAVLESLQAQLREPEGFRSYGAVRTWLEQAFGLKVEYATVYKTVRYRLGAKLKAPRPQSLKQDAAMMTQYKKTSPLLC